MAWTSRVTLDADKDDVGSVTVTWNEGLADEMVIGLGRWEVTSTSKPLIVAEAVAKKAAREALAVKETNLETVLDTALNA